MVSSLDNNTVKLNFCENVLEISASSSELGEAQESMAIEYTDAPVTIAFNPRFLMDPLKALQDDDIYFEFKDELSPGIIKTNDRFLCVVMPLRLQ